MREGKKGVRKRWGVVGGEDSRRNLKRLKMLLAALHSLNVHQFQ